VNDTVDEWRLRTGGHHGSQDPETQEFETQQQSLFVRPEMQRKFKQFPFNLYTQAVDWYVCTLVNTLIYKRLSKGVTEVCVCVCVSGCVKPTKCVAVCGHIGYGMCVPLFGCGKWSELHNSTPGWAQTTRHNFMSRPRTAWWDSY